MLGQLRGWEWLIIIALIVLLFGAKRLPDAARGVGRSLRIFKAETKGLADDSTAATGAAAAAAAPPAAEIPPAQPAPPTASATGETRAAEPTERAEG